MSTEVERKEIRPMTCEGCGYLWQDEDEDYPSCHYPENDPFPAPCEEEDYED